LAIKYIWPLLSGLIILKRGKSSLDPFLIHPIGIVEWSVGDKNGIRGNEKDLSKA
jgi:hypothetical protein